MVTKILIVLINLVIKSTTTSRFHYSLNGMWNFKISSSTTPTEAIEELQDPLFFSQTNFIDMPVPSSYNDVTTNSTIRDHVGWVWYWRDFSLPLNFPQYSRYFVKFGSVHYSCRMWYNGKEVGRHDGGHIPFEIELTDAIIDAKIESGRILLGVNNTLTEYTLPQGKLTFHNDTSSYPRGFTTYTHDFDYFDYSGLNGNVELLVRPRNYVADVNIVTQVFHSSAIIKYGVYVEPFSEANECHVQIVNPNGNISATSASCDDSLVLENPTLWWPVHSFNDRVPGRLYTMQVKLLVEGIPRDTYVTTFGIREITLSSKGLLINHNPVYLKGFGMHEDAEIRGRGFDWVSLSRDMYLLDWTNANVIRTSHYPYSEEFINLADKRGLMVIMETPACSLSVFDERMLQVHKRTTYEMIKTFRNHPSIIMWSLANEPYTSNNSSDEYFKNLAAFLKHLDDTRLITFVTSQQIKNEKAVQHMDIICVNRYNAWYQDSGRLEIIPYRLGHEVKQWATKFQKPVIITEYGAGAIAGQHELPSAMWSEEYQTDLFAQHFDAFDSLRLRGFLAGELIWNFADFKTPQEYIRPGYCAKGIFTRNRQPKVVAKSVRDRYALITGAINEIEPTVIVQAAH